MGKIIAAICIILILSCGTTTDKPSENNLSSEEVVIDKTKFDQKWIDAITQMADTDNWVVLSDDSAMTLVQVLTSHTNRHFILYSKNAEFDINGLAWMKIEAPKCIDVHVYNCDVNKLNFSIRDSYSTDYAFEKLNAFIYLTLLKTPNKKTYTESISKQGKPNEEEWKLFWGNFKTAFSEKAKSKIKEMTAPDFFDGGGGGSVDEWLENIAFANAYNEIKISLAEGVKKVANEDGTYYKVTGQGDYGDLYFEYKGKWVFGGVVGD